MDEETKKAFYFEGYADPVFFCRVFLPEWFPLPMPWVHRGILAILTRRTEFLTRFGEESWHGRKGEWTEKGLDKILRGFVWKSGQTTNPIFVKEGGILRLSTSHKTLIMLPRGFSKTTLLNAGNLWSMVYSTINFLLYISEAAPHAEAQLGAIKAELEQNAGLIEVYGDLTSDRGEGSWAANYIETRNHVTVAARGRGGQIRGLLHKGKRPDRMVIDDVEDEESVATEMQRTKTRVWLMRTVLPALKRIGGRGDAIALGNMLHPDGLLPKLAKDPSWITVKFGSVDMDGEALWPDIMTLEERENLRQSHIIAGNLSGFYLEYDNEAYNVETALFTAEMFKYGHRPREDFVGVALAVDPAIAEHGDYFAIAVVGIDAVGKIHVLDFYAQRGLHPREQVDKIFDYKFRWNPTKIGIEATAYQQALVHLVQAEMFIKGKTYGNRSYFHVEELKYQQAKVKRIKGVLAPRYRAGYITHQQCFPLLESQLIDFREDNDNGEDDGPDVVAMAVGLLDPFAGLGGDEQEMRKNDYEPADLEYAEYFSAP